MPRIKKTTPGYEDSFAMSSSRSYDLSGTSSEGCVFRREEEKGILVMPLDFLWQLQGLQHILHVV